MNNAPKLDDGLSVVAEIVEGIPIIRIHYDSEFASRLNMLESVSSRLMAAFENKRADGSGAIRCGVVVEARFEFEDQALIRSILSLWDAVSRLNGQVFCVGYPRMTVRGCPVPMPPLMPGLAFSRTLEAGIQWSIQPVASLEGGENWNVLPGSSRGRSLIPGERFLEESEEDEK